jgi:ubiquinone/menaquinone biosynthesis C-methylase UbiE
MKEERELNTKVDEVSRDSLYLKGEEKFGFFSSFLYDTLKMIPTISKFYSFVMDELQSYEFNNIMDMGCGTGNILLSLATIRREIKGIGIDPSRNMVAIGNKKAKKMFLSDRISFMQGSSRSANLKESYDICFTSLSFHHWKEKEKSISYILSNLRDSGKFIVFEITNNHSFNRLFVKHHLMNAVDFRSISSSLNARVEISEKNGFIKAVFFK